MFWGSHRRSVFDAVSDFGLVPLSKNNVASIRIIGPGKNDVSPFFLVAIVEVGGGDFKPGGESVASQVSELENSYREMVLGYVRQLRSDLGDARFQVLDSYVRSSKWKIALLPTRETR
jgi:hypothetical protein